MPEDYAETSVSRIAREYIRADVVGSLLKEDPINLKFKPEKRKHFTKESGTLDIEAVYKSLTPSYEGTDLVIRAVEINLTEEETHELIKERFRQNYSDSESKENAEMVVKELYPVWCHIFGIEPDKDFRVRFA